MFPTQERLRSLICYTFVCSSQIWMKPWRWSEEIKQKPLEASSLLKLFFTYIKPWGYQFYTSVDGIQCWDLIHFCFPYCCTFYSVFFKQGKSIKKYKEITENYSFFFAIVKCFSCCISNWEGQRLPFWDFLYLFIPLELCLLLFQVNRWSKVYF